MFIVVKLDVDKNRNMFHSSHRDREQALSTMFKLVNEYKSSHTNKVRDDQYIEIYKNVSGYFRNSRELEFVYQIMKITKPEDKDVVLYSNIVKNSKKV